MTKDEIIALIEDQNFCGADKKFAQDIYTALESASCLIKDKEPTQATSELDELREWLLSKEKGRMLYDPNHYFVDVMIQVKEVLAKIDSLKSGDK